MPDLPTFVLQSVIPLMFLLAIPGLDRRKVLLLWPLTHVADLDYVIGHHRATGHNVWLLVPLVAILVWSLLPQHRHPARAQTMLIALAYMGSHIVMDVFAGGVTLFYPFSTYTACFYGEVNVYTATNTPEVILEQCSFDGIPVVATKYAWLWGIEAAFLAFLVPATLGVLGWKLVRRYRSV